MNLSWPMMRSKAKRTLARVLKSKTVRYHGLDVQGAFEDFGLLRALARGTREPFMTALYLAEIRRGTAIVDVGAHIGHYSLLGAQALRRLGAGGRIDAFEANSRCFAYLSRNVAKNSFGDLIAAHRCAVAERLGTAVLYADNMQSDYSSLVASREGADDTEIKRESVPAVALDEHFKGKPSPDLFKIDIEGAELGALRGMRRLLTSPTASGGAPVLFIESNAAALSKAGSTPEELVREVCRAGFDVRVINEETKALDAFDARAHGTGCYNLIFKRTF